MSTIANFNRRIQSVNFRDVAADSVYETRESLPQYNRDDLSVGLLSTGQPIQPRYKSTPYATKKYGLNSDAGFGTPDLKLTGAFYRGIFATVDKSAYTFTLDSSDSKAAILSAKYTNKIYGLTQDAKQAYATGILRPVLIANLKKAIGI